MAKWLTKKSKDLVNERSQEVQSDIIKLARERAYQIYGNTMDDEIDHHTSEDEIAICVLSYALRRLTQEVNTQEGTPGSNQALPSGTLKMSQLG